MAIKKSRGIRRFPARQAAEKLENTASSGPPVRCSSSRCSPVHGHPYRSFRPDVPRVHDLLSSSNVLLAFRSSPGVLLARGSESVLRAHSRGPTNAFFSILLALESRASRLG